MTDADHAPNKCNQAAVFHKVKLWHDSAVLMILKAHTIFSRGSHFRHFDTSNNKSYIGPKAAQPGKCATGVPLKAKQISLPNITLIDTSSQKLARYLQN